SWAVPAGSGFAARMVPSRQQHGEWAPAQRKLASTGTAEAAALEIAERVRTRRHRGEGDVVVTANRRVLAVLGGLAVLTALSVTLTWATPPDRLAHAVARAATRAARRSARAILRADGIFFWRGSNASRRPSPMKLMHRAMRMMNRPGHQNSHGRVLNAPW